MKLVILDRCEPTWTEVRETDEGEVQTPRKRKLNKGDVHEDLPENIEQRLLRLGLAREWSADLDGGAA